jgi:molybdenum cofactor synthesis domain-containing protein
MTNKKEISAGIIIIGNEVLSGRTKDINTSTLSLWLNSLGVQVKEVRIIPDIEKIIIDTVNELRNKFNYVFTTGGIGPTHDDITAESISKAFNLEYGFHKEAFSLLEKYYDQGEFNEGRQKMAKMPKTANLILNPTSGAPGFYIENVFCLPGVPSILKSMIGGLNNVLVGGDPILSKTINLRTYESEIAQTLTGVQNNNKEVDIGSYPFFRQGKLGVSIVLRSTDQNKIDNCNSQILEFVKAKNIEIVEID